MSLLGFEVGLFDWASNDSFECFGLVFGGLLLSGGLEDNPRIFCYKEKIVSFD